MGFKFNRGDIIRVTKDHSEEVIGMEGEIVGCYSIADNEYAVDFHNEFELGCDLNGSLPSRTGRFFKEDQIELVSKITTESDKKPDSLSKIGKDALEVVRRFARIVPSAEAMTKIERECFDKKSRIRNIFRTHPNWDEERQAIIFSRDENRDLDPDKVRDGMHNLFYYINNKAEANGGDVKHAYLISDLFVNYGRQFVNDDLSFRIESRFGIKIASGTKTSKALNKLMHQYGFDQYTDQACEDGSVDKTKPSYDKLFAIVADALNPITVRRFTLLSINLCDFLLMSNGTGWRSCHLIGEGGWQSGTLSYALDDVSFVLFTVDGGFEGKDFFSEPKITRQIFAINEDKTVYQSRLYPCSSNTEKVEEYRNLVEKILAECFNIPNLWNARKVRVDSRDHDVVYNASGATNYPDQDYTHYAGGYNTWLMKPTSVEDYTRIEIGSKPICVKCGSRHTTTGSMICRGCNQGSYSRDLTTYLRFNLYRCAECGSVEPFSMQGKFDPDDDKYYCTHCSFYCECCGERKPISETGGEWYSGGLICDTCTDEDDVVPCSDCGAYVSIENSWYIDSGDYYVCCNCGEENYGYCASCDSYHYYENGEYIGDEWYCNGCIDEYFFRCTECGDYVLNGDAHINEFGDPFCEYCYDERYTHCDSCDDEIDKNHDGYWFYHYNVYCDDCIRGAIENDFGNHRDRFTLVTDVNPELLASKLPNGENWSAEVYKGNSKNATVLVYEFVNESTGEVKTIITYDGEILED